MRCSLQSLFIVALVLNAHLLVSSDENVTGRAELSTVQVATPSQGLQPSGEQPGTGNVEKLPMEGGGSVTVQEPRPTLTSSENKSASPAVGPRTEGGDPTGGKVTMPALTSADTHTLNDEAKHTDVEKLLETENEQGGARTKSSSIVARKGAPPEAPGVTEEEGSAEVQSLFNDETKNNGSAMSGCLNSTHTNVSNCSNEKLSNITDGAASTTHANNPQVASEKQTVTVTLPKPVTVNELLVDTHTNTTIKNSTTMQNNTHNSFLRKKFKPATTSDVDEPKEQQLTPDTPASKGDYIIPIIGIILAVPMVVILFMFFYKRSAEFWERRHYKRMDFLIDGMYND